MLINQTHLKSQSRLLTIHNYKTNRTDRGGTATFAEKGSNLTTKLDYKKSTPGNNWIQLKTTGENVNLFSLYLSPGLNNNADVLDICLLNKHRRLN